MGDAKIAGSAVWRAHGGFLQHGSILLHDDQGALERFRRGGAADTPPAGDTTVHPTPAAAGAARWLSHAPDDVLRTQLADAITAAWSEQGVPPTPAESSIIDRASAQAHAEAQAMLADPAWLWRR